MSHLKEIDGSLGEGGGQVLRIALCLSALHRIPIKINNIRAGRPKPGLAAQHLKGVELLQKMCNAKVHGAYIGSTELEFKPGNIDLNMNQVFCADTQTAGCISLLIQVVLPYALFLPKDVIVIHLKGGTNVPMGPQIEFLTKVLKPVINKFGADFCVSVQKRGYYPRGGGEVSVYIYPVHTLKAVTLTDPGLPQEIFGQAYVAGVVPIREAHKMANDVRSILTEGLNKNKISVPRIDIDVYKEDSCMTTDNGSGIKTTRGCIFGGSGLGSSRGRYEKITPGEQAANEILDTILAGSCVDEHMQDQLVIFMTLAKGLSRINIGNKKLTRHTQTAIDVAEMILSDFDLHFKLCESKNVEGNTFYSLECEGCGYENKNYEINNSTSGI